MSGTWRWEYDPDSAHVTGGVPDEIISEVERLTTQLTELADMDVDIGDLGNGPHPGGLRRMDAAGGWFYFLASPRDHLIIVVRIVPPFEQL